MSESRRPPAVIDVDAGIVRRSIRIHAPIEAVWAAVTESAHLSRWLGHTELDGAEAGSSGTVSWPDRSGIPLRIEHIEPPHRVSYRWSNDDSVSDVPDALDVSRSMVFSFELEGSAEGTLLTVTESGFDALSDPAASRESHRRGWVGELDELANLLERA